MMAPALGIYANLGLIAAGAGQATPAGLAAIWAMDWSADDQQLHTIVRAGSMARMELWTFSLAGGEPKRQALPAEWRGLSFSPDGKYVATTRLTKRGQVWALEDFLPAKK